MWRCEEEARKCPSCGHAPFAKLILGMQRFDEEERRETEAGRWIMIGCIATGDDPDWGCTACGTWIWRDGRIVPFDGWDQTG